MLTLTLCFFPLSQLQHLLCSSLRKCAAKKRNFLLSVGLFVWRQLERTGHLTALPSHPFLFILVLEPKRSSPLVSLILRTIWVYPNSSLKKLLRQRETPQNLYSFQASNVLHPLPFIPFEVNPCFSFMQSSILLPSLLFSHYWFIGYNL